MWKSPSTTGGTRKRQRPTEVIDLLDSDSDESSSDDSSVAIVFPNATAGNNGRRSVSSKSKKIIDKFLAHTANGSSVREAVALQRRILESDSDSSSTGSDLGKIWGLTSVKQENGNDSGTDSSDDSSIEVLSHPPSPRPVGMNGRYLSGRQRRLEMARSKNSANRTNATAITSTEQSSDSSDDEVLFLATRRKALESEEKDDRNTNDDVTTPATRPVTARKSTFPSKRKLSEIETSKSSSTTDKTTDVPSVESKPPVAATIRNESGTARKSTKNKSKKAKSREFTVFDNLFWNGKDFLHWTGITDPHYFLDHHKEFVSEVNVWRKDRKLPLFKDPKEYIATLRDQIKNNLQRIGTSATKKQPNRGTARKSLGPKKRTKQKRKKNQTTVYPLLEDLPMEGGEFVKYMGIKDIFEIFKRTDLHKHVNVWRKKQNLPLVENERSRVAKWRKWIRQNMKYQTASVDNSNNDDPPEEIDFSNCMKVIEPLSKRFLSSETGLPVYQFAVYDTLCKDIIYEFRVEARPSLIPNAGNGAFLTYLGAREASPVTENSDVVSEVEVIQPLVSKDFEGYHLNVKVVGDYLKETSKNIQYPPPTSLPPVHGSPEKMPIGDTNKYPWKLQSDGKELLSRYEESSDIAFATNHIGCSVIEIGRYGPFRRSDRKYQLHYDLKNFVFSNEVSEWGFDIVEDLNGNDQVADVTDDTTGMPHQITTQNICMYVNETGGDPKLKQTVWSGQVADREVNYYFKTDVPMKKGETIELLISYFDTYDEIRERKGYGERNKNGLVRSDDHFATLLERNFVDRYDMVEVIYEIQTSLDLYLLSEFLEGIRAKLAEIVDAFIKEIQSSTNAVSVPYAQQIIALRRLNWLKPFFLKKIESFQKRTIVTSPAEKPVLRQCAANVQKLDWKSWGTLMDLLEKHPNLVDGKGLNVRSKFRAEVTEDICYGASSSLICPCNEEVWCDAATTLTHDLCFIIARDRWNHETRSCPSDLHEAIVKRVVKASKEIRSEQSVEALRFDTDIWKRYVLNNRGSIAKESRGTSCLLVLADDCKGPEKRLPVPYVLKGNLSMSAARVQGRIHKPWYLARQVLFLADVLAQRYLADKSSYSFDTLRESIGLTPEEASMFFKRDIELDLESSCFYGTDFDDIYSTGNKLVDKFEERAIRQRSENKEDKVKKKKKKQRTGAAPVKRLLFWDVLINGLKKLGWDIEKGNRDHDWYLLPPGVQRGKGFKPRIDFFDSAPLVIKCLKTDIRYCQQPPITRLVEDYTMCLGEYDKMKNLKSQELKTLTGQQIVDHLLEKVRSPAKDSTNTDQSVQNDTVRNFKAVFDTDRLGLLLHVVDGQVIVKGCENLDFVEQINPGDEVIAVGDHCTRKKSLKETFGAIKAARRPLTITFERKLRLPPDPSSRNN